MGPEPTAVSTMVDESAPSEPSARGPIEGRSLGRIAWTRLKRDKVAMTGAGVVVFLILVAVFSVRPFGGIVGLLGHPQDQWHQDTKLIDPNLGGLPLDGTTGGVSAWGGAGREFLLGLQPTTGRDVFSMIVYGAQFSLLISFLATLVAVVIGVIAGVVAGYFGGWVDSLISRIMDLFLAFPLLIFALALISVLPNGLWPRVWILVFIIGGFSWPYIGRVVRGQTLSLREREFVEAARSIGARNMRVVFRELLPNLAAPILVYATLIIPTNILFEAALSFLGVGIPIPNPSWGQLISDSVRFYEFDPFYMIVPGLAIFVTVLAFNLFGDGLRDALDPKGVH